MIDSQVAFGALFGVIITLAYYLILGWRDWQRTQRISTYLFDDWSLSDRTVSVSVFSSSMSLATVVIALMQLSGIFGLALSWATLTFCFGWVLFLLAADRVRSLIEPTDTVHSFLGRTYASRTVQLVAAFATLLGFLGLFATELFAANIISSSLGFPSQTAFWLMVAFACVTLVYTSLGGFRSVVRTDWSQALLLLLALGTVLILSLAVSARAGIAVPNALQDGMRKSLPLTVAISLFFINVFYPFVDTQAWQRLIAARSPGDFKKGTIVATFGFAITWTTLIIAGVLITQAHPNQMNPISSVLDGVPGNMPVVAFIVGMVLIPGLLAAMISSADGFINAAAHIWLLDLHSKERLVGDADVLPNHRAHGAILGVVGLGLCLGLQTLGFGIVDMVFAVSAGQVALFPALVCGLLLERKASNQRLAPVALCSIVAGFLVAWANGIYSTSSSERGTLHVFGFSVARDVYASPMYSVVLATAVYLVGAAYVWVRGRRNSHETKQVSR